jgi:aminoglycoside phosphotransferase (APT) family kinase protein
VAVADAVRALAPVLGEPESAPVALEGGITNRNFRLRWGGRDCVLRCPGKDTALLGIDRRTEWAATRAAAAAGVGPEPIAFDPGLGCLVTAFIDGRPVEAEELRARIPELAAALRAIHGGPPLPSAFDPFAVVADYARIASERGGAIPPEVAELAPAAAAIRAEHGPVPCHNDLLTANLLDDGERLRIVDWEYAGMGDPYFELANLAVKNGFGETDEAALLEGYWGAATPERRRALRLMRVMASYWEGMWGVLQATVSELDFDFRGYASEHLGRALAEAGRIRAG